MIMATDVLDDRIDLDSIDLACFKPQCMSEIISRSGTDNQHVVKRGAAAVLLQQMYQGIRRTRGREWDHALVPDRIHSDSARDHIVVHHVIWGPAGLVSLYPM